MKTIQIKVAVNLPMTLNIIYLIKLIKHSNIKLKYAETSFLSDPGLHDLTTF